MEMTKEQMRDYAVKALTGFACLLQVERPLPKKGGMAGQLCTPSRKYREIQVEAKCAMAVFATLGLVTVKEARALFDAKHSARDLRELFKDPVMKDAKADYIAQMKDALDGNPLVEFVR